MLGDLKLSNILYRVARQLNIFYSDEDSVAEQATEGFSQFSSLQIQVLNVQPQVPPDMLELVTRVITNTEARLPALERSVEEIKIEWKLT